MKIVTKVISITLASLLLMTPIAAQQSQLDACTQANMDAKNDTNAALWIGAGCFLNFFGILGAYVIEPTPQATKLLGKDASYVAIYTDCYKSSAKKIQTTNALYGCLGCGVGYLAYVLIVAASISSDPYYNSTY